MSGHSKWHNIQATKSKADAARGKIFTKIGREIAVAVKLGGPDPNINSKLYDVVQKANRETNGLRCSVMYHNRSNYIHTSRHMYQTLNFHQLDQSQTYPALHHIT